MEIIKPEYYDSFHCLAGACPDTCCREWDILVDSETVECYRKIPGSLGFELRKLLKEEDGDILLDVSGGRCPMQDEKGLCRIQLELGHDALCRTCREFPRLTHDYGDFQELGLELSCPEAARLILASAEVSIYSETLSGGEEPEYDRDTMKILLRTREKVRTLLSDSKLSVPETLAAVLLYSYQVQEEVDGGTEETFDAGSALEDARQFAVEGDIDAILDFFKGLEILTTRWQRRLDAPAQALWDKRYLALARYFVDRYWLQAVSDFDLVSRVKLMVVSCLVIRELGGDLCSTAQLYSKEIENDVDNIDAILDGAYECPAFRDNRLLGLLLL